MGTQIERETCRRCRNPKAYSYARIGDAPYYHGCDLCGLEIHVDLHAGEVEQQGGYGCVMVERLVKRLAERQAEKRARISGIRIWTTPRWQPRWRGFRPVRNRQRPAPLLARWRGFARRSALSAVEVTLQVRGKWREFALSGSPGRSNAKRPKPEPRKRLDWKRFESLRPEPRPALAVPPAPSFDDFDPHDIPF